MSQAPRRVSRQQRNQPSLSESSRPVAEGAGRKDRRRNNNASCGWGIGQLRSDNRRKRQVAERAIAIPPFVTLFVDDPALASFGMDFQHSLDPLDAHEPVALGSALLRTEDINGEHLDN